MRMNMPKKEDKWEKQIQDMTEEQGQNNNSSNNRDNTMLIYFH